MTPFSRSGLLCLVAACVVSTTVPAQTSPRPVAQAAGPAHSANGRAASPSVVKLPVVFPPGEKKGPPKSSEAVLLARANKGDVDAMVQLGDLLPSPKDFPWYLKAAEGGNMGAMLTVADAYREGSHGVEKNAQLDEQWTNKALPYMKRALEQKDAEKLAQATLFYNGRSASDENTYRLASGRAGGFELGNFEGSIVMNNFPTGIEKIQLLQKCVDDGHVAECGGTLAKDYLMGADGAQLDPPRAIEIYHKLAMEGDGFGFPDGWSKHLTQAEAIELWEQAIEHGDMFPAFYLADAYCAGDGVPKNGAVALGLLQEAISRASGKTKAVLITSLAEIHLDGKCLPVNEQLFLRDFNSASSADLEARQILGWLASNWARAYSGEFPEMAPDYPLPKGPAAVIVLKNMASNGPPFNGAEIIMMQYNAAVALGQLFLDGKLVKQSYPDAMTWFQKAESISTNPGLAENESYNNGHAENSIGMLYDAGQGVPKDSAAATDWYRKSAAHKNSWGEFNLASKYMAGSPTAGNATQAVQLYRASADAGNAKAQYQLASILYVGKYLPRDLSESAKWAQKSDALGNADATVGLAGMYQNGYGVGRDPVKAVALYQKAVAAGNVIACIQLANLYYAGDSVPKDLTQAFNLFRKAADAGDPRGEYAVGYLYKNGLGAPQDLSAALNWYQKAASRGDVQAEVELAAMYRDGVATAQDFATATSLYEKAAAADNAEAQLNLGDIANAGSDAAQAAAWYRKAADHGIARAQFSYGYLLEHGQGVAQNNADAARYYQAAANQNFAAAENNLGMMYEKGLGVNQDQQRALQLYQSASTHGDSAARGNAQQLTAILEQQRHVAEAQAAAQKAQQDQEERQQKIADLRDDIERQEETAKSYESSANDLANTNNCSGAAAAICQALSDAGAAKERQKANQAHNQANDDRSQIERLQGLAVQQRDHRDTSYMGNLAQTMNEHPGPTIQDTLAQQQSQFNALAVAAQQRQAAVAQASLDRASTARQAQGSTLQSRLPTTRQSASATVPSTSTQSTQAVAQTATSTSSNPYTSTGGYNGYNGTGAPAPNSQPKSGSGCIQINPVVSLTVDHPVGAGNCVGEAVGHLSNHSTGSADCVFAFLKGGIWTDGGGMLVRPGESVGGELSGMWACGTDKPQMRYACFQEGSTSQNGASCTSLVTF